MEGDYKSGNTEAQCVGENDNAVRGPSGKCIQLTQAKTLAVSGANTALVGVTQPGVTPVVL